MSDLSDFKNKNTKFTGTTGQRISTGSTGQRVNETARLRFNTTSSLMEYYTGTEWKSVDAPPTITTFNVDGGSQTTSTFVDRTLSGNATFVIIGSLFSAGATVSFIGTSATITASSVTVNSGNQLTALIAHSSFLGAQEPYSIRVTNLSGLFATLESCLSVDAQPVFNTASGTLGTIADSARSSYTISSAAATDPDGDTITYSITSGALPTGLSISSSTGAITGTASAVGSNTTSTFTVSAATTTQTATRSFSITVNAPIITTFTSTGAFTFSVPAGVTSVRLMAIGGGGGGGNTIGGGGGAGGMLEASAFPVTPGGSVSGNVGTGGPGATNRSTKGTSGGNTTFGPATAVGGGGAGSWDNNDGIPGGSGGGGARNSGGGSSTQSPSGGATGFGHSGGTGNHPGPVAYPGGGGGAGSAGVGGSSAQGGSSRANDITGSSVAYAGGGGGGTHNVPGGAGGGGGAGNGTSDGNTGGNGTANRGSGAGGGGHPNDGNGGQGGSGIVVVRI
jgi:hypothetical protein